MPAVPTLGVKLHTNTQYGRNQLASRIGVHNLSIYLISLLLQAILYSFFLHPPFTESSTSSVIALPEYVFSNYFLLKTLYGSPYKHYGETKTKVTSLVI